MAKPKQWNGTPPTKCDLCGRPIGGDTPPPQEFVDGRTKMGMWGILCVPCHKQDGVGLGTGRGQKYVRNVAGRWDKVEG